MPLVHGEVRYSRGLAGNRFTVELEDTSAHQVVDRTSVAVDGSFEFRNVRSGRYEVRLTTEFGDVLVQSGFDTFQQGPPLVLTVPEPRTAAAPQGAVSVGRLRHEPNKKAMKALIAAQKYSGQGDYARAAEELRKAIRLDPECSEAHGNLGAQLIRTGKAVEAIPEFQRAIELDPGTASHYSNLAFALMLQGQFREALEPATRAVRMESTNVRANCVLGYLLARSPETLPQAVPHLRIAAREMPKARFVLAQVLRELGNETAARQEIDQYAAETPGINPREIEKWKSGLR